MPKKTRVKVDDRKWQRIKKQLFKLNKAYTLVGIFSGETREEGLTNAEIAFINEFGTNDGHIPERPFMRGWFDSHRKQIEKVAEKFYKQVVDEKMTADMALKRLGEWYTGELKKSITNLKTPPNAPVTIRLKGSSNPLIDTGQMRNSVTHKEVYGRSKQEIKRL